MVSQAHTHGLDRLKGMSLNSSSRTDQPIEIKRDVALPASSPQEYVYAIPHNLNGLTFRRRNAASCRQHGVSSLKTWWPFLLSVVFVFLTVSICHHNIGRSSVKRIQVRRLGESESESDDDLPRPLPRDLAELCGDWTYEFPLPGEPRASPGLVEAVLASVEEEVESGDRAGSSPSPPAISHGLGALVPGRGLKRLLYGEDSDEEDYWGPSSKVARTYTPTSADHTVPSPHLMELGNPFPQPPQVPPAQYQAHSSVFTQPSTTSAMFQLPYATYAALPASQHAVAAYGAASAPGEGLSNAPGSGGSKEEDVSGSNWMMAGTYTSTAFEHAVSMPQYPQLGSLFPPPPEVPPTQYQAHSSFLMQPSTSSAILQQPYPTNAALPAGQHSVAWSGVASVSGEGPSDAPGSLAGHAALPLGEAYPSQRHPPVRLPVLQPGVVPRLFVPGRIRFPLNTLRSHVATVLTIRKILLKARLTQRDVDNLMFQAELLAGHAFSCMFKPIFSFPLSAAVEQLARRFLVFRALFLTAHVVKQDWWRERWWMELGNAVPTDFAELVFTTRSSLFNRKLAVDLSVAVRMYKSGFSPSSALEVDLMKRLFCEESSPRELRNAIWEPLRQDYEDSPEDSS
ncbi:hypothetical protein Emag_005724 [Eimeria magna]